jgi:hypothetical protein
LKVLTQRGSITSGQNPTHNGGGLHVSDIIPLTLDHLRVPWMSQELPTHVNMLSVIGNISRNAPALQFRPYTGQLLNHVLRVLNICVYGARFRQKFTLEDAIGPHACSLQASRRVTNGILLGSSLFLPVHTVNCVQTLKAHHQRNTTSAIEVLIWHSEPAHLFRRSPVHHPHKLSQQEGIGSEQNSTNSKDP